MAQIFLDIIFENNIITILNFEGGERRVPKVIVKKNESVDKALRRLKKKIDKEGIMKQIKQHRHYEKPSQKRRRKMKDLIKKALKSSR